MLPVRGRFLPEPGRIVPRPGLFFPSTMRRGRSAGGRGRSAGRFGRSAGGLGRGTGRLGRGTARLCQTTAPRRRRPRRLVRGRPPLLTASRTIPPAIRACVGGGPGFPENVVDVLEQPARSARPSSIRGRRNCCFSNSPRSSLRCTTGVSLPFWSLPLRAARPRHARRQEEKAGEQSEVLEGKHGPLCGVLEEVPAGLSES
jgi:hypothetical protein